MKKLILAGLLSLTFALSACSDSKETEPTITTYESWQDEMNSKINLDFQSTIKNTDTKNRTWYEIFVYSFNDSNGDGIGDLKGITESLDYIEYMGFSGIWLTPVHPSTTYHKYDVTDYYSIDPQYGTMEDFDELVAECSKRGIAVIMDLVINHTSSKHPWFVEAIDAVRKGDFKNKYIKYYNFADEQGNGQWKIAGKDKYYECQFWSEMPDLNLENDMVRSELADMFKFWLDRGISGFRLDAVKEYVTGNTQKNIEILSWLNKTVKAIKPDAYLVGEAWEESTGLYEYYRSGIDSFFNFNFAASDGKIAKTVLLKNQKASAYADALLTAQKMIKEFNTDASDAAFFTNHDTARAAGFLKRDSNLIKIAWAMNLMQSGNAYIYYGEELGMTGSGKDENKRAPMFWTDEKPAIGVTYGPPNIESAENFFGTVTEQLGDETSILEFIRKAIILRNKYPALAGGEISVDSGTFSDKVCLIHKSLSGEKLSLFYNISAEAQTVEFQTEVIDWLSATGEAPVILGNQLTLPPYSIVIIG